MACGLLSGAVATHKECRARHDEVRHVECWVKWSFSARAGSIPDVPLDVRRACGGDVVVLPQKMIHDYLGRGLGSVVPLAAALLWLLFEVRVSRRPPASALSRASCLRA